MGEAYRSATKDGGIDGSKRQRLRQWAHRPPTGPLVRPLRTGGGAASWGYNVTWLKLSDDYHDQCASLSDAAYRTHTEALGWAMRRETGGFISERDIRRFAESESSTDAVKELLDRGFWEPAAGGYRIKHHMEHQPEPEVIAKRRENTARRVRRNRKRQAGLRVVKGD